MKTTLKEQVKTRQIELEVMEVVAEAIEHYRSIWLKTWDPDADAYREYREDEKDDEVKIREAAVAALEDKIFKLF